MHRRRQGILTAVGREHDRETGQPESIRRSLELAGVCFASGESTAATLPFSLGDVSAGSESELQAVVMGRRDQVDLPLVIEQSNYFANMVRRARSGEAPQRAVADLERFLQENRGGAWENSWVRFPRSRLSSHAQDVLERDLMADKSDPAAGRRGDEQRFSFLDGCGREMVRLPISYLLKLALADLVGSQPLLPPVIRQTGARLMDHYLNDNTSPETFSFTVVSLHPHSGMGRAIARETGIRFLLTQLLLMYANEAFGLGEEGQTAMTYFAPLPPVRQKELNELVSDSFYRELFMSPCLSGWDRGEEKHRYMRLCHQVLSRSQLNAVAKLRDAGIILNNLVVLPNLSNTSLANNGTHISLGSRRLTRALADGGSGFTARHEKNLGDLAIKICEHFLPLFVGTYSAAPCRLAFTDFHPEKVLGFLPHELDYTHLRMIWRRWRKKADLSVFGHPLTPFGPEGLDRVVSALFGLRGDFVADYRLLDYLACLLSTDRSPALDGILGNGGRLLADLTDMGIFDRQMSVYLLYKLREFGTMGFSGFEGRQYSLFGTFQEDMGRATDLQTLITALAYKYMAQGVDHRHIPDTPSLESERRQVFFGTAIGIPTFFVRRDTPNLFLQKILRRTAHIRSSHRYPGYLRVYNRDYRLALLDTILEDGADLVELMDLHETLDDLRQRLIDPERCSAVGRLTSGILAEVNASDPLRVDAREFNCGAEQYYRTTLRKEQMREACGFLEEACQGLHRDIPGMGAGLRFTLQGEEVGTFVRRVRDELLGERADTATLRRFMNLLLLTVYDDGCREKNDRERRNSHEDGAPVHRAG